MRAMSLVGKLEGVPAAVPGPKLILAARSMNVDCLGVMVFPPFHAIVAS